MAVQLSDRAATGLSHVQGKHRVSVWYLIAALAALATTWKGVGPASETDLFWHIKVGQELVTHHTFPVVDPWNYTFPERSWHTTQWLSEVLMYFLYHRGGLVALNAAHLILVAALCTVVGLYLIPSKKPWAFGIVYAILVSALALFDQMRPEIVSLLFLVWLSVSCWRAYATRQLPSILSLMAMTWLWANFHGYWLLVPVALLAVALAHSIEPGRSPALARRLVSSALATTTAGLLTPMGPGLLKSYWAIAHAAKGNIIEWQPTVLFGKFGFGIDVFLVLIMVAWARSNRPVPGGEIVWFLGWSAFSLVALRDVAPALLMLAPWITVRLGDTFGFSPAGDPIGPAVPLRAVGAITIAGVALAGLTQFEQPALDAFYPSAIANLLARQANPVRVLDDYDVSGFLILLGGQHTKTAIDGRADRYGYAYIHRYLQAENGLHWRSLVDKTNPELAVLPASVPLTGILVHESGWRVVLCDGSWRLLARRGFSLAGDTATRHACVSESN